MHSVYGRAGISRTSGVKTLVIATDSDSMAYGVFIASYKHGTSLSIDTILDGGINVTGSNNTGTIAWSGHAGTVSVFGIPLA